MLTDIEFTNRGDLVLGITNRSAFARKESLGGDIRKMCLQPDGSYVDESSDVATTSCASHEVKYEQADKNHETYYEFYVGDYFGADLGAGGHPETASGALAQAPGAPNIMVGMVDATDWWQPGAIGLYSNTTGDKIAAQAVINKDPVNSGGEREPYGAKAGGMGDIELLCDPAPIEIGNYVWMDLDQDGIQDPNEPPMANVPVALSCDNGAITGTATTDANGHYYFGGPNNANIDDNKSIVAELDCTLSIDKSAVNGKPATTQDPNNNANDAIDNDAADDGNGHNVITFTTQIGNDHSLDFGIEPAIGCASGVLFQDDGNSDGALDGSDHRAPAHITVEATDAYGNTYTAETNANGEYSFPSLVAGDVTVKIDTTDTDIPEGATWDFTSKVLTINDGTGTCTEQNYPYDLPSPVNQDPADVATCANPGSITWDNAHVGTKTEWANPAVDEEKTITTAGGTTVDVTMKIINDNDGEYNAAGTGTNGHGAFSGPYLTLYLGDQDDPGDGNWQDSDGQGCAAHHYDLEAGESYQLEVTFSEPVVLDNWRIRDVDSGDVRNGDSEWEWQDGIKVEGFDANGNAVPIEAKIGNSGAGLIVDQNGIIHTDKDTYNAGGGDFATGGGSSADSTNGHIVLTSNFQPITKLVITHSAGPDMPCQTRSALAMAGLAVCKPLHISGKIFDDPNGTNQCNCTNDNSINGTPVSSADGHPLYVCAVNTDTNKVVDAQQVASDGSYDLSQGMDPSVIYRVVLTDQPCTIGEDAPTPTLPADWKYEGESDGDVDGSVEVDFAAAGSPDNVTDLNFAINKVPEAHSYNRAPELNPGGTEQVTFVNDGKTTADFIADSEQGQAIKIKITRFSGGTIYYDGTAVTEDQVIDSPDFSKFTVDPDDGDAVASFAFVAIDDACRQSEEAVFTAPFTTLQISGYLFHDSTLDGQVNGEVNASSCDGTTPLYVNLIDTNNKVLASMPLEEDGSYVFRYEDGVRPNTDYTVLLSQVAGAAGDDAPDTALPDGCVNGDGENIESLTPGTNDGTKDGKLAVSVGTQNITEANFAITQAASIGDTVWYDDNRNGIQDSGEEGVSGVTVSLKDDQGNTVATITTDSSGHYLFDNLVPGDYQVVFDLDSLPEGYVPTAKNQGGDDTKDSDVDPATGKTETTTLDPDEHDMNWDMGLVKSEAKIGDTVWMDDNGNGAQDPGEKGVKGVKVELLDENGNVVDTATTDENGRYGFTIKKAGKYRVRFDEKYNYTKDCPPCDPAKDSDVNGTNNTTDLFAVAMGDENLTIDAGISPMAHIGDDFWFDDDKDGVKDPDEKPVKDGKVELLDENGNKLYWTDENHTNLTTEPTDYPVEMKTGPDGKYGFDVPANRKYKVRFTIPKKYLDQGYSFTTVDENGNGVIVMDALAAPGTNYLTLDAGISCGCAEIESDSVDAVSSWGMLGMFFVSMLLALGLMRTREEGVA
jgi:hypothetical protein